MRRPDRGRGLGWTLWRGVIKDSPVAWNKGTDAFHTGGKCRGNGGNDRGLVKTICGNFSHRATVLVDTKKYKSGTIKEGRNSIRQRANEHH